MENNKRKIYVIGHKNPDTDSICSAIAYADIKNRTEENPVYEAKRAGQINEETLYVLKRFQMNTPAIRRMSVRVSKTWMCVKSVE